MAQNWPIYRYTDNRYEIETALDICQCIEIVDIIFYEDVGLRTAYFLYKQCESQMEETTDFIVLYMYLVWN